MSFRSDRAGLASPSIRERTDATAISVTDASAEARAAYAELCATALSAPAQSSLWIGQWTTHVRPDSLIAMVRSGGRLVFALALEVVKSGPFRTARFMGGRHANGNFPATDPGFLTAAGEAEMRAIIAAIHAARPDIDIVALERLLPELDGAGNPLALLPHVVSPNRSFAVDLHGGFEAVLVRVSGKRKRKKHRSQMRKFEAAGGFNRIEATTPEQSTRLMEAFFAMKEQRFRKMGIRNAFNDEGVRDFFQALFAGSLGGTPPAFVLHGLEVAGTLRAVTGSSRCRNRLICEFGAIIEDELAHASPGDFLFFENIEEACGDGVSVYDFSVGDEPYKRLWCDMETRHFDVVVPLTPKGQLLALTLKAQTRLKAFAKNSPVIWKLTRLLRKRVAARSRPADD